MVVTIGWQALLARSTTMHLGLGGHADWTRKSVAVTEHTGSPSTSTFAAGAHVGRRQWKLALDRNRPEGAGNAGRRSGILASRKRACTDDACVRPFPRYEHRMTRQVSASLPAL
jgi:hypothetical protein